SFAYRDDPGVVLAGELTEHRFEVLCFAKIAIDGSEADIGHIVELAQVFHHDLADRLGGNFGFAAAFELAHDGRDHLLDPLGIYRAFAQRYLQRAHQLVAVERHAAAIALNDGEFAKLHPLEGCEAKIAGDTYAPPADHGGVLGRTRV